MEPTSAAIIAGGALAGGLLGKQDAPGVDYRGAKKGIRWRVRDAKEAGIHPLYALGAPGIGSAVTSIPGQNNLGQSVETASRAVADAVNTKARSTDPLYQAQLRGANAQAEANEAQAALYRSEAARITQGQPGGPAQSFGASGPYSAPFYNEIMPDGTSYRRTSPDSAMDGGEVLGAWFDRWVHGSDAQKRSIERRLQNHFSKAIRRTAKNNPGRKAAIKLKAWWREMTRRANADTRWR